MDLQTALVRLKDHLEANHHFKRSNLVGGSPISQSTEPIAVFLAWLEGTPQARQSLRDLLGSNR